MQHFLQTEAPPRCSNKQAWNRWNPSQLSIISGNLHNYQQVIIPAHEGQLAALQFSPSGGTTRKYVNRLLSERPQTFWGTKRWNIHFRGEMWKYMIIAKTLVSLKHIARDENVLTKFSSGHRIATASEKGTVIRWRIFVLCSSCTDHYIYPLMIFQIFGEEYKNHFHFIINTSNTNTNFQGFLLPWRCEAVRAASWPEKARYDAIIIALLHHVTIISMVHSNNHIIMKNRTASIFSLSFSPCGAFLACSSNTETVHVFRLWMVVVMVLVFTMMLVFLPCSSNIDTIHVLRSVNNDKKIWTFLS